jgi:hypothetical protein
MALQPRGNPGQGLAPAIASVLLIGCVTGRTSNQAALPTGSTVAVLAFSTDGQPDAVDEASIESALLKLGLKVVDRSTFVALMKEQRLDLTGAIRPEDAHTIGNMSGAAYFIVRQQQPVAAPELDVLTQSQMSDYDDFIRRYLSPANNPASHEAMERDLDRIGRAKTPDPFGSLRLMSVAEGQVLGAATCRSSELGGEVRRLISPGP